MKKRVIAAVMATVLLAAGLMGCAKKEEGGPVVLKAGFSTSAEDPRVVATNLFKERVEKGTDGRIQVEIHTDGELGSDADLISGVMGGSVDITASSAGNFASYVPQMGVSAFPFLFDGFEDAWQFVDGEVQSNIETELEDYNIKVIGHYDNGFRCVTTSEERGPVSSVADMDSLKIRTPENEIVMQTMLTLGAKPSVLEFTKLYDALKNGEYDAQENPIPVIYNNKLYEVQANLSITNHSYDTMPFVISKKKWDSMSEEDQKVVAEAAAAAQKANRDLIKEQTDEYVGKLSELGMNVVRPDLGEFREATASLYDSFAESYGKELIEEIKK